MQLDKLYQTASTTSYDFDVTAPFMSLSDITADMGDQYLMGYCTADRLPESATPVRVDGNGSQSIRLYGDYNKNYGYGFAVWGYTGGAAPGALYYLDDADTIVRSWGIDYDFNFINRGEMCRVCANPSVSLYIQCNYIRDDLYDGFSMPRFADGGSAECGGIRGVGGRITFTFNDFCDMIENDTPIINGTGTAQGRTFTVIARPSDFGDPTDPDARHYVAYDAGNGYYVHIEIEAYYIQNTPIYYNNTQYAANIMPFYQIDVGKKSICVPGTLVNTTMNMTYDGNGVTVVKGASSSDTSNSIYDPVRNIFYGGFNHGTLDISNIDFTNNPSNRDSLFYGNYHLVCFSSNTNIVVVSCYTPIGIYNHVCMFHKHTATPSETYSTADTVTVFTAEDVPTLDTVSGSLSDIVARLRPWQIPGVDITTNNFTPEDIPDPTPGDEGEESGDTIDFIMRSFSGASNFITNYAMTRQQVGIFGNRLWTSWVDSLGNPTEMIRNIRIFYTGGDTGSIDIGSVMPFIVSMKIFPFDLSNFIGYVTNGIKIGTGHYPISVPGCWYLPRSSVYVSCGTVTIPKIFNDFRDYENMNIMCYVPYCGTVELNPGDVIGRTLSCTYGVDLQSGGCTAYIIVDNNYPVATISGQMGSSVPLTATNSGQLMSQRLSDISGASALIGNTTMQVQRESERPHPKQANMDSAIVGAVLQAVDSVPQRFRRSAISCPTMSAGNGLDAFAQPPTPYIQMRYGIYDLPANYKHSIGRISTKSNKLSEYKDTGFITCSNVDTSPLTCHNDEKAAIKAALESGVYI